MSRDLSARLKRLEEHLAPPASLDHVAAMLDRLGARDPDAANDLLVSFGLTHRYPVHPDPFTSVPSTPTGV